MESIESVIVPVFVKKARGASWGEAETMALVDMVSEEESNLFGCFDGFGIKTTSRKRGELWKTITSQLNSRFTNKKRTVEEVTKKYNNLKQRVKQKVDDNKKHCNMTGGGPSLKGLNRVEEHLLSTLEGRPVLEGVQGGIDTDRELEETCVVQGVVQEEQVEVNASVTTEIIETTETTSTETSRPAEKKTTVSKGKRKLETISALTEKNLSLDNLRLERELQKLDIQIQVLHNQNCNELLKKQKMELEIEFMQKRMRLDFSSGISFLDNEL